MEKNALIKPDNGTIHNIPQELTNYHHWVIWKYELEKDKWKKVPYNPITHTKSLSNKSNSWESFNIVVEAYLMPQKLYQGIGFVFSNDDEFCGIDLDNCRNIETSIIEDWALKIIKKFNSYTEISPSGTGVKIFVKGKLPGPGRNGAQIEMYDQKRFFTVTGHKLESCPGTIEARYEEVIELYNETFGKPSDLKPVNLEKAVNHVPFQTDIDLDKIIKIAGEAKNGDKFKRLWTGDFSDYTSQSQADSALCFILAFYTKDSETIDQLFRQSKLYRSKWDDPHSADRRTYGEMTISEALKKVNNQFEGGLDHSVPQTTIQEDAKQSNIYNLQQIMAEKLPDLIWVVPSLIPQGFTILYGKPKLGKSLIAMDLAISVGSGGKALGKLSVSKGKVLYLALEDGIRRIQTRAGHQMDPSIQITKDVYIDFDCPQLDQGGLKKLDNWMINHPDTKMIIIDTLGKIWPVSTKKSRNAYIDDVGVISGLKKIADKYQIALICIHHDRKASADDFIDSVSGTTGIAGSADTIIHFKRTRNQDVGELEITGRDVSEKKYAIKFDKDKLKWVFLGDAAKYRISKERQEVFNFLEKAKTDMQLKDIADKLGKKPSTITNLLIGLIADGLVVKSEYGKYKVAAPAVADDGLTTGGGCIFTESGESNVSHETGETGESSPGPLGARIITTGGYVLNINESSESGESNETGESGESPNQEIQPPQTCELSLSAAEAGESSNPDGAWVSGQLSPLSPLSPTFQEIKDQVKVRCTDCLYLGKHPLPFIPFRCNHDSNLKKLSLSESNEERECRYFKDKASNLNNVNPEPIYSNLISTNIDTFSSTSSDHIIDDTLEIDDENPVRCVDCGYLRDYYEKIDSGCCTKKKCSVTGAYYEIECNKFIAKDEVNEIDREVYINYDSIR